MLFFAKFLESVRSRHVVFNRQNATNLGFESIRKGIQNVCKGVEKESDQKRQIRVTRNILNQRFPLLNSVRELVANLSQIDLMFERADKLSRVETKTPLSRIYPPESIVLTSQSICGPREFEIRKSGRRLFDDLLSSRLTK